MHVLHSLNYTEYCTAHIHNNHCYPGFLANPSDSASAVTVPTLYGGPLVINNLHYIKNVHATGAQHGCTTHPQTSQHHVTIQTSMRSHFTAQETVRTTCWRPSGTDPTWIRSNTRKSTRTVASAIFQRRPKCENEINFSTRTKRAESFQ